MSRIKLSDEDLETRILKLVVSKVLVNTESIVGLVNVSSPQQVYSALESLRTKGILKFDSKQNPTEYEENS